MSHDTIAIFVAINCQVARCGLFNKELRVSIQIKTARIAAIGLLLTLFFVPKQASAAANIFGFNPTTLSAGPNAGTGPNNPTNGSVVINGSSLTAGDTIVFDGIVANTGGITGDNWGSVNFNAGGFAGLTGARFGVLLRTGTGANQCQVYTNGVAGAIFPGTSEIRTNRVLITLYVSTTGSATNMGYRVQIDQGLTGSFTSTLSGTNLTFPGNSLALTFSGYGVNTVTEWFAPTLQGLHLKLPDTNLLAGATDQSQLTVDYLSISNVAPLYNPGFAYSSSNPGVVTVTGQGLLQAQGNGSATVTASYYLFSSSQAVTVTNVSGALNTLRLVVTNQMLVNATQQGDVRGDFANVSNVDISSYAQPAFVSGNSNVLMVSSSGVIAAIAPGSTTVSASYGGLNSLKIITTTFPTNRFIFDTFGDGFWTITNALNGQVLTVNANGATQFVFTNGATDQQFELLYNYQNSTFRIRQRSSWLCIGTKNSGTSIGTGVATITYSGTASQQWYLVDTGNGLYRIISKASNYALQTDNGSPATVTIAGAWTNAAQIWGFSYQTHYPKKGCAGYEGSYAQLGLNWAYNYNDNTGVALPASVNFVPMIYSAQYWEPLSDAQSRAVGWQTQPQPDYLLCYNEPDNASQSNTSTNGVISQWPQIQALNLPLVGPATQNTEDAWENSFYQMIAASNYRVDYSAVHEYVPPNASSLISDCQSVYNAYGRPVWLTEFSPVDWNGNQGWTEDDDYNFLAEFMWQAEGQEWLKRYSIFPFSGTNPLPPWQSTTAGYRGNFFLDDGATLAPYGELYAAWDGDLALHARTPYIIHNLGTSFRLTDTNNASTPQSSSIYVRNATTEWALLPAPATGHWYIVSLNDGRRLRNNGGTLDLAPYGTTNSTVDWWFNGPDGNGYYYLDNLARSQSIRGTGTAPAISFSMINDPAPSTATQWRLIKPYQPITIVTAVPPVVSIASSNQSVALNWVGSGLYYDIYRGTTSGGPYTKIVNLTTNSYYSDSAVQNGTTYYYAVTALNILGEESSNSVEASITPEPPPPSAPTGLTATSGNNQAVLSWNGSAGATSYNVKYSTTSGSGYVTNGTPTTTNYTDATVVNGTTYYYVVSAVNGGGESANSVEVSVTPEPPLPSAPTGLTATPGDHQVILNWNASSGATSYNVKNSTVSGSGYATNGTTTMTNFTDTTPSNGIRYYYVVSAVNGGGESSNSAEVSVQPVSLSSLSLNFFQSGNGLQFNWPSDHIGWRLMMNTNSLANSNAWVTVPNSASTNQMWIPIDSTQSSVFFQLIYP